MPRTEAQQLRAEAAPGHADARVDACHAGPDGALSEGLPTYASLRAALAAAPAGRAFRILVEPGLYREKLVVTQPGIALLGRDPATTRLSFDAVADGLAPDGTPWGTAGSATLTVQAPDFSASGICIENDFDYITNWCRRDDDAAKLPNPQAVAVLLDAGADRSAFRNVHIRGHQDTLFVDAGRSHFHRCLIAGHVDFILGAGQAVFDECEIVTRYRPDAEPMGWITAASTQRCDEHGMLFWRCHLVRESEAVGAGTTYLGRPWHPTTNFPDGRYADPQAIGSVCFLDCWMDAHIRAEGWDEMGGLAPHGERIMFSPRDARFREFNSHGPGAHISPSRPQLGVLQAAECQVAQVLGDWQPPR